MPYDIENGKRLAEAARKAMEGATEVPWCANDQHSGSEIWRIESDAGGYPNDGWIIASLSGPDAERNARFIAYARNNVHALATDNDAARAEIERLREALEHLIKNHQTTGHNVMDAVNGPTYITTGVVLERARRALTDGSEGGVEAVVGK